MVNEGQQKSKKVNASQQKLKDSHHMHTSPILLSLINLLTSLFLSVSAARKRDVLRQREGTLVVVPYWWDGSNKR